MISAYCLPHPCLERSGHHDHHRAGEVFGVLTRSDVFNEALLQPQPPPLVT